MKLNGYLIVIACFIFFLPSAIGVEFTNELNFNISLSEKYKNRVDFTITTSMYPDSQIQLNDYILKPTKPHGIILPESLNIRSNKGSFDIKRIPEIIGSLHIGYTNENGTSNTITLPVDASSENDKLEIKKSSKEPLIISKDNPLNLTFSMIMDGFIREYNFNSYSIKYSFNIPEVNTPNCIPNTNLNSLDTYKNILYGRVEIPFGFLNYSKDKPLFIPYVIDCSNKTNSVSYSFDQTDKNSIIFISAPDHKEDFYLNFLFTLRDSSKPPIKIIVEDVLDATNNINVESEVEICNENYENVLHYVLLRENNKVNGIKFLRDGGKTIEKGKCSPKERIKFEKYSTKIVNWYPLESEIYSGQRDFSSLLNVEEGFKADFEIFHTFKLITRKNFELEYAKINYSYNSIESISDLDIPEYQKEGIDKCKGNIILNYDPPFLDEGFFESPPSSPGGIFIYKTPQTFLVYSPFKEGIYTYNFKVRRSLSEIVTPFFILIAIFIIVNLYLFFPNRLPNPKGGKKLWFFWLPITIPEFLYQFFFNANIKDYFSPHSITLWLTIMIYVLLFIFYFKFNKK